MNTTTPTVLRPKQAAQYLGISLSGLWLYIKRGDLTTHKISKRVTLIKKTDLDAFIDGGAA